MIQKGERKLVGSVQEGRDTIAGKMEAFIEDLTMLERTDIILIQIQGKCRVESRQ